MNNWCYRTLKTISLMNKIRKRFPTISIEQGLVIKGNLSNLMLGRNVQIQSGVVLHLGGMEWCLNQGMIEIGENSVISPNCVIYGAGPGGVHIGKNFDCGPGVGIFSSGTNYEKGIGHYIFAPVIIGDDVMICSNSVISPGTEIGRGAVIAACSVVTKNIPENAFAGGAPARVIKILRKN